MRILAVDAATRTGWAFNAGDGFTWGAIDILSLCSKKPSRGERLAVAGDAYAALMAEHKPDLVLLESPFARGQATTRLLYGYAAAVEAAAHLAGAACLELEPSSVRKRVLGSGVLADGKATVLAWAREQGFALDEHQDDEADALLLLHAGLLSVQVMPPKTARVRKSPGMKKAA